MFSNYIIPIAKDRNDGLIAISNKGIKETRYWEEGRITIDIDNKTFDYSVYYTYTKEEYEEDYEEDFDNLEETEFKTENIPFEEFEDYYSKIKEKVEKNIGYFKINKNTVIGLIY